MAYKFLKATNKAFGAGALSGKMLLVRIMENTKLIRTIKGKLCPAGLGDG